VSTDRFFGPPVVSFVSPIGDSVPHSIALAADVRGWEVMHVSALPQTLSCGKVAHVVGRADTDVLYRLFHRSPVAVLHRGSNVLIRTSPTLKLRSRDTRSVQQFCCQKAFVRHVAAGDFGGWEQAFVDWMRNCRIDGPGDPRCLPLHIFSAKSERNLDFGEERSAFSREHPLRNESGWTDHDDVVWKSAQAGQRHGRDPLQVRGVRLHDGMHWDVTPRRTRMFHTHLTTWTVKGYVNVHPDAHVRVGHRAYEEWSAADSREQDRLDLAAAQERLRRQKHD